MLTDLDNFKSHHLEKISYNIKSKIINKDSKSINKLIWNEISDYIKINDFNDYQKIIINYIGIVLNIQERHRVRPFEYMDFSRRIGELWQKFCMLSWDLTSNPSIKKYDAPKFDKIKCQIINDFENKISAENFIYLKNILNIIPKVNLKEDLMFKMNDHLNIIDFKSGFGSNEKGNMQRLLTLANVYKLIEPQSTCYLLVRQVKNNNYLNHLEKSTLWKVIKGNQVYSFIKESTDIDIELIMPICSNLLSDIEENIGMDLSQRITDIEKYTLWY